MSETHVCNPDPMPPRPHVMVHCHTCHEEWWADGECLCPCPPALELWHEGRAHRHVFYSRPLLIPCSG